MKSEVGKGNSFSLFYHWFTLFRLRLITWFSIFTFHFWCSRVFESFYKRFNASGQCINMVIVIFYIICYLHHFSFINLIYRSLICWYLIAPFYRTELKLLKSIFFLLFHDVNNVKNLKSVFIISHISQHLNTVNNN